MTHAEFLIAQLRKVGEDEAADAVNSIYDRDVLDRELMNHGETTLGEIMHACFLWSRTPQTPLYWADLAEKYKDHSIVIPC